jgi:SAM-dependent methyltransferase
VAAADPVVEPELLDRPDLPFSERERALADLERVNRWLLGFLPVHRTLLPRIRCAGRRQRLLDVGTGSGEVAAGLARAAARHRRRLTVVGVDAQLSHLVIGRRRGSRQLRVVAAAEALPFRDASFDWTLSTHFFHHFDGAGNRRVLAEMRRTAARAAVVVDLRRGALTTLLARLLLPLAGLARTACHDGVVSASRSFTVGEVRRLLADLPVAELRRRFPRRFSLLLPAAGGAGEALRLASGPADDRQ